MKSRLVVMARIVNKLTYKTNLKSIATIYKGIGTVRVSKMTVSIYLLFKRLQYIRSVVKGIPFSYLSDGWIVSCYIAETIAFLIPSK